MTNLNHNPNHDFRAGDWVEVIRKVGSHDDKVNLKQFGWDCIWTEEMDGMVGATYQIEDVWGECGSIIELSNCYLFPSSALKKVSGKGFKSGRAPKTA